MRSDDCTNSEPRWTVSFINDEHRRLNKKLLRSWRKHMKILLAKHSRKQLLALVLPEAGQKKSKKGKSGETKKKSEVLMRTI